jgi:hypothetical protein
MANVFPFFDSGTWEGYNTYTENVIFDAQTLVTAVKSNDYAFEGEYSGKITFQQFYSGLEALYAPNFFFNIIKYISGRPVLDVIGPLGSASAVGQLIKFKCRVYTPSSNPIGSDDLKLTLCPNIYQWSTPVTTNGTMPAPVLRTEITVADCKDTWAELEFHFIPTSDNFARFLTFLSVMAADVGASLGSNSVPYGITPSGSLNEEGVLYIDGIEIEKVATCDLELGTPSYSKTDETAVDANDGTITINASTSHPPLQYSIDGGVYQLSNLFEGVAPGTHSVSVRDAVADCEAIINDILILAFDPPDPPEPPIGGTLVINSQPTTQENFISWFPAEGPVGYEEVVCDNCCWDLPNPYRFDIDGIPKDKAKHYPIAAIGEKFTFYVNFQEPITYPNRTSLKLAVVSETGLLNADVAPLKFDIFDDGSYNIYCDDVTLNVPEPGIYRLVIYDSSTTGVLIISNGIELMTLDEAKCLSTKVEYRCSDTIYGTRYPKIPDFLNTQRLRLYKIESQVEGELSQYRSVSSGKLRNISVELDDLYTFEAYYFDDLGHQAMKTFLVHNLILLNGKEFVPKSLYKIEWNRSHMVNKGTCELYNQQFSMQNRYSNQDRVTVIGSDDPLFMIDNVNFLKL